MKFLFDFFPILLFFIAYKAYDIYVATAVAIVASFIQVGWLWLQHRRVEKMHVITLLLIVVLGGATLALQDPTFIMWKPSLVNWAFALVFVGSHFIGKKTIVQRMMEKNVALPGHIWPRLNIAWSVFFVFIGFLNLYVAYNFDEATWVNFKLFGMIGLTFVFIIAQAFFIGRYMKEPESANPPESVNSPESVKSPVKSKEQP
ncbi:septation protein A [Candidatus Tenderia electrophaga]|jgi:intracellular septation protein|uniref:Inner membrane-spanning protein YciB n=1 Tax=Candidatus Tenderia electrophaga TaxID=1748243 RepID=A0A0S2TE80_9GAMM|nr:septation protein A [Candidatus Tenderia electrophaga]